MKVMFIAFAIGCAFEMIGENKCCTAGFVATIICITAMTIMGI